MGMAGALAAFFGCPLGGSLFALEVNSRFGVEYFEHISEAIFSGVICLAVFRQLAQLPLESIWEITLPKLENTTALEVVYGIFLGFLGAGVAFLFANLHWKVMELFQKLDLIRNERAIHRGLFGAIVVVALGLLYVPNAMCVRLVNKTQPQYLTIANFVSICWLRILAESRILCFGVSLSSKRLPR